MELINLGFPLNMADRRLPLEGQYKQSAGLLSVSANPSSYPTPREGVVTSAMTP